MVVSVSLHQKKSACLVNRVQLKVMLRKQYNFSLFPAVFITRYILINMHDLLIGVIEKGKDKHTGSRRKSHCGCDECSAKSSAVWPYIFSAFGFAPYTSTNSRANSMLPRVVRI